MAAGSILFDAQGRRMLDAQGRVMLVGADGCCWRQARACADDAPADVWVRVGGTTPPGTFQTTTGGDCYYLDENDAAVPCPSGTRYEVADLIARSSCEDEECVAEGAPCSQCGGKPPPLRFLVSVSGIVLCACAGGGGVWESTLGDLDGDYCCVQTSNPCVWQTNVTGQAWQYVGFNSNCPTGLSEWSETFYVRVTAVLGGKLRVQVNFDTESIRFFAEQSYTGDCADISGLVINNSISGPCVAGSAPLSHGGTVTVTAGGC